MITAEQAREHVEQVARQTWPLPSRFSVPGAGEQVAGLVKLHEGAKIDRLALAASIDALSDRKRVKLFKAFAPGIGAEVARWWDFAATGTFQEGWERRPFRTHDRTLTLARRIEVLRWLLRAGKNYPKDIIWLARYSFVIEPFGHSLGELFASEISAGNRQLRDLLIASAHGQDEVGRMSSHVVIGLLRANDPHGWQVVEQLLLAAQRQEGLRQSILEAIDFAHPAAFRRMLGLLVEHKLTRFAATVRAASVWFGEAFDVRQERVLVAHLTRLIEFFDTSPQLDAIRGMRDATDVFLALWRVGHADVAVAESYARSLLASDDAEIRLAAARFLSSTGVPSRYDALTPGFKDPDDRIVAVATHAFGLNEYGYVIANDAPWLTEEQVEAMLGAMERLGRSTKVQVGILGPLERPLSASLVADRLVVFTPTSLHHRLGPAYAKAGAGGRRVLVARLAEDPRANRQALFAYVGDAASDPRTIATKALLASPEQLTEQEAVQVEALLTRKAADLRRGCLELLRKQSPAGIASSASRLAAGTSEQAGAAKELQPGAEDSQPRQLIPPELVVDDTRRTPVVSPVSRTAPPGQQQRCTALATGLVAWLDEHKDVEVRVGTEVQLLADVRWLGQVGPEDRLPLAEILEPWWERVEGHLTDGGLECQLVASYAELLHDHQWLAHPSWVKDAAASVIGKGCAPVGGHGLAQQVLAVIARRQARSTWAPALLDAYESILAAMPLGYFDAKAVVKRSLADPQRGYYAHDGAQDPRMFATSGGAALHLLLERGDLAGPDLERHYALSRFLEEPAGRHVRGRDPMMRSPHRAAALGLPVDHPAAMVPAQADRFPPDARLIVGAYEAGVATRDDLLDWFAGDRSASWSGYGRFVTRSAGLYAFTGRVPEPWVREAPRAMALAEEIRDVALDFEKGRGEFDTPVSHIVASVRTAYGARTFVDYLAALGKGTLVRGYIWSANSRSSALCRVLRKTLPAQDDTPASFEELVRAAKIPERRLIEVGVYAPQWASYVEHVLDWPGFEDGVWWLHAHTKGDDWSVDQDVREEWAAQVSQRTPLDSGDLVNGAVDVRWFGDVLSVLGEERFDALLKAAKFASTAGGHKRAELFAAALRGQVSEPELLARITDKRHQDSVRALGLVPLPDGGERDDVLLRRYELLRGFVASDRSSGSQRRASEATSVLVGMENLARTAGYRDPQRLVWAMEAHAVSDLAAGPVSATHDDLTVTLAIGDSGAPELSVRRGEKTLASVPTKSAKVPEVAELKARVTILRKQASRMRQSLEQACVSGEVFSPEEYAELLAHPMIAPMLRDLVLVTEGGQVGFGTVEPGALVDEAGAALDIVGQSLRVAHPLDLLQSGRWPELQHVLFTERRKQPFRQAFRELYVPTAAEADAQTESRRYAGHQVQQRTAAALFRSRGWVSDFEIGFGRTFHQEKITAWCSVLMTWGTPGEVEDAALEGISFHPARSWQPLPLTDVPPRIFSEVMRDLDLVVSVAHAGGVDPETSESSVQVRRRLVEETCELLGMTNIETTDHHALVKGKLGTYSINLGSGVVHRQPGNAVCIIPIGAQHRGRIFLPFVDDDPRTAEVISKVVMLARDDKIQDPTILAQLG